MRALFIAPALSLAIFLAIFLAGCSHAVNVTVDAPHTQVIVDGNDLGAVGPEGKSIEVRPGMEPLRYILIDGERTVVGSVARTEPVWWIVALGVGGALCCAPALASLGFCAANPAVISAPLLVLLTGDAGVVATTCASPSWLTLPFVATSFGLGLAPLGAAFVAETVPAQVVIGGAAPPDEAGAPQEWPAPLPAGDDDGQRY